ERAVAFAALGDGLDAARRPAEAFAAWSSGAALLRREWAARAPAAETPPALARRLAAWFAAADEGAWRGSPDVPPDGAATGHVFLLGFPRSGTTLAGQVLAGHPRVVTLDEAQTLRDAAAAFFRDDAALRSLAAISQGEAARYRALYWRRVAEAGGRPAGKVFVDKLPMNTVGLPLIVKLFPEAKIVFMRRDPRDVILGCVRRQFALDPTTAEFLDLGGAARFYDAAMALFEIYRETLDVDPRIQGYEALVADFDGETRALCDFLGLDWSPAMAGFAARAGDVATPSGAQLARGLTAEGVGHWRRYRAELAPVLPILDPWARRFGYGAD
ncbi:MAG: sulfotransferase, partial [Caulobacteraceae bacterium]